MTDEHDDVIEPETEANLANDGDMDAELDGDYADAPMGAIDTEALLDEAREDEIRVRASWHLLPKENFAFLFANCLFFAGALCAWSRMIPPDWLAAAGEEVVQLNPSTYLMGLDTIRGTLIFVLAMYGFFQIAFNIMSRTTKVWPFMINALLALEVGIGGISSNWGGKAMEMADKYLENAESKTMMDDMTLSLSAIPPAYWVLTMGGMIVLVVILNGIMSGAKKAKLAAAEAGSGRRRR